MSETYDPHEMFDRVVGLLGEIGWRFGPDPERLTVHAGANGRHGVFLCAIRISPERPAVSIHSHVQCRVPAEKRLAVAEFITRANYGLPYGNFELDFADGEVRFKTSILLADGELTKGMLNGLIGANLSTADRYLPGLMSVLWNDAAAEDAVSLVEAA
jgi:hypothetical protein